VAKEIDMTQWFYIKPCQESGFKGHCGPVYLMDALSTNLLRRGMKVVDVEADSDRKFFLDQVGGMIMMGAHVTEIEVDGLLVRFFSQEISGVLRALNSCHARKDIGRDYSYYKIRGRFNCLCLLPDQFDTLLRGVREVEPIAEAIAADEFEETQKRLSGHPGVRYRRNIPEVTKA